MRHIIKSFCLFWMAVCIASAQDCLEPPTGIVAWWTANNHSRDVVSGHEGILFGDAGYAPGYVRRGFRMPGSPSYVQVPDSADWNLSDRAFTIEFWVMWNTVRDSIIGLPDTIFIGNDESGGNRNKWFFARGGGVLNFHVNSPTLGPIFFCQTPFTPVVGVWYHLAITRQGSDYRIYANGELLVMEQRELIIPDAEAPLTIGQAEGLGYIDGILDEMTLYHRALSHNEIQMIYQAGTAGKCLLKGDVNESGCVDDEDLLRVLFAFGQAGQSLSEDLNDDGLVDDADLLIVLFNFGDGC
jgi:hypothetical protein